MACEWLLNVCPPLQCPTIIAIWVHCLFLICKSLKNYVRWFHCVKLQWKLHEFKLTSSTNHPIEERLDITLNLINPAHLWFNLFAKHKGISNNGSAHNIVASGISTQNSKVKESVNGNMLIDNHRSLNYNAYSRSMKTIMVSWVF